MTAQMTSSGSSHGGARRTIYGGVLALGLAAVGVQIIVATYVHNGRHPALSFMAEDAGQLIALSKLQQKAGDSAEVLLVQALHADPLRADAVSALALIAEKAGNNSQAESLMQNAAARSLHAEEAHRWLLVAALKRQNYSAALVHADVLFRAVHGDTQPIADLVARLIDSETGARALTTALAAAPPWRGRILGQLVAKEPNLSAVLALFQGLRKQGAGLSNAEADQLRQRLIHDGRYELAYLDWLQSLPAAQLTDLGYLYNARFDKRPSNMTFDWQVTPVAGAEIKVETAKGEAPQLKIEFGGGRVAFQNVQHFMLLSPGVYQLRGLGRADHLTGERGLVWQLICNDATSPVAQSGPLLGTQPWKPFRLDFTVSESCRLQVLKLVLPARSALETIISGRVAYKNLDVQPVH